MAKLAVKDDWFAPVERNRYERQWYEVASARVPGAAGIGARVFSATGRPRPISS
jgi:hypothetical protein